MAKRIIEGALGTIAVLASFLPRWYAFEDFPSAEPSVWQTGNQQQA